MNILRRLILLAVALVPAGCSSPLSVSERNADATTGQLTTATDSSPGRGGGNLMGGN
jgi:hypothetical protein